MPEDRNIFSEVMESHQKNGTANSKIFTYVSDYYLYPKDLDSIAYISQILQLKAIQYGVEHWRRNRGRCMGSLYWQLNDCWPVASWASIDYYGRWKALHYGAKRFYSQVLASASERAELSSEISYFAHNDTLQHWSGTLKIELIDTKFNVLHSVEKPVSAAPLCAKEIFAIDFAPYIKSPQQRKQVFASYKLMQNEKCISKGTTLFVKPKHFSYPDVKYKSKVKDIGEAYEITVSANGFANYTEVYFENVDAVLSDNFFDITSPKGQVLHVQKNKLNQTINAEELEKQIVVRSVVNSYAHEGGGK